MPICSKRRDAFSSVSAPGRQHTHTYTSPTKSEPLKDKIRFHGAVKRAVAGFQLALLRDWWRWWWRHSTGARGNAGSNKRAPPAQDTPRGVEGIVGSRFLWSSAHTHTILFTFLVDGGTLFAFARATNQAADTPLAGVGGVWRPVWRHQHVGVYRHHHHLDKFRSNLAAYS